MILPNIPNPARCSFGSAVVDGKIYIAGGHINETHHYGANNVTNDMNVYDIELSTWSALAPRPIATQGFSMFAYNNYIYALGGLRHVDNGYPPEFQYGSIAQIDRYDINTDSWTTLSTILPKPRSSYMAGIIGSVVYLIGGWNGIPEPNNPSYSGGIFDPDIVMFDLATEAVSVSPNKIYGSLRRAGTAISIGQFIVIAGGITPDVVHPSKMFSDLVQMYTVNGQYAGALENLPNPNFAPGLGVTSSYDLYLFGGYPNNHEGTFTNKVWFRNPHVGSWQELPQTMTQDKGFVNVVNLTPDSFGLLGGALNPARSGQQSNVFESYSYVSNEMKADKSELWVFPR